MLSFQEALSPAPTSHVHSLKAEVPYLLHLKDLNSVVDKVQSIYLGYFSLYTNQQMQMAACRERKLQVHSPVSSYCPVNPVTCIIQ